MPRTQNRGPRGAGPQATYSRARESESAAVQAGSNGGNKAQSQVPKHLNEASGGR